MAADRDIRPGTRQPVERDDRRSVRSSEQRGAGQSVRQQGTQPPVQQPARRPSKPIKASIMTRVRWLYAAFALIGVAIMAMIALTQWGPNGKVLRNSAELASYRVLPVEASRGNIYSHDGLILATDSPSYTISLDFTRIGEEVFDDNYRALADSLHRLLPQYSRNYYENRLLEIWQIAHSDRSGRMNQQLFREKVNQLELDRMCGFPIFNLGRFGGGFKYEKDPGRFKPYDNLASRTIGRPERITGPAEQRDTVRALGLEAAFNDTLRGHDGRNRYVHLFSDVWVPVKDKENVEVRNGRSIITTLDVDLQDIAETELRNQMLNHSAMAGTAIIMEVKTGEVRALSNLSRHGDEVYDDQNHAISMMTEPGSTFKLVSLLALLDEAGYDINMPVDCTSSGRYKYVPKNRTRGYDVVDSHPVGKTTLRGVMEHSSNIGFVKVIDGEYRDNPERFVNYVKSLGFDRELNMQLVGGRKPIIKDPQRARETAWDVLSLMKMAYGYAIEVTPAHTLMLYNAVANNGRMVAPRLVKAVVDGRDVTTEYGIEVVNEKICSDAVLATVRSTLEGVVLHGTGSALKNRNYTAAGKTGTAQLVFPGGGYTDRNGGRLYLATFVGYFPAENPQYSCIVAIKTYNGPGNRNAYYGAQLALPAFKAIADQVYTMTADRKTPFDTNTDSVPATLKGGNPEEVKLVARALNIPEGGAAYYRWNTTERAAGNGSSGSSGSGNSGGNAGSGSNEGGQDNSGSGRVAENNNGNPDSGPGTGNDRSGSGSGTDNGRLDSRGGNSVIVPSVTGMGLKDAIYVLESAGLTVEFSGIGKVSGQSVEAGKEIPRGGKVGLTLAQL